MQIFKIENHPERVKEIFNIINVDSKAFNLMLPKTEIQLLFVRNIPGVAANIVKQEMLSLGADAAISKNALVKCKKSTDILLIGTLLHLKRLTQKLNKQPLKILRTLSQEIKRILQPSFLYWKAGENTFKFKRPLIMGVINITPDSFSGDGLLKYTCSRRELVREVLNRTEKFIREGVDIIDIGGQSSRPGARSIPEREEVDRVLEPLRAIKRHFSIPVSVDTYRAGVAKICIENGASIINDIKGLRDKKMRQVLKNSDVGIVVMHMKGTPLTMQKNPTYESVIMEIIEFLRNSINKALEEGIEEERIVIDPGIGFGKTVEDNYKILKYLEEFSVLKRPLLIGTSRKSFIGAKLNLPPQKRLYGSLATFMWCLCKGAHILRVHDVYQTHHLIKIYQAIKNA